MEIGAWNLSAAHCPQFPDGGRTSGDVRTFLRIEDIDGVSVYLRYSLSLLSIFRNKDQCENVYLFIECRFPVAFPFTPNFL
jgi:hypothetical protein